MPANFARNLKKLVSGDEGYDPNVDKYEVDNVTTLTKSVKSICTIAELDAQITALQTMKADEITKFDDQIADLEQLKLDLLGL